MKKETIRLRFNYRGTAYAIVVHSTMVADSLIVNKVNVGHACYWLIFKNNCWRFIGDMPLCRELKIILVSKVSALHQLPEGNESALIACQDSVRTSILLNTLLSVLAKKEQIL